MSEIRKWLESIGLAQYADAFEANEIGMDLLGQGDDQMLKDLGVSIGGNRLRELLAPAVAGFTEGLELPEVEQGNRLLADLVKQSGLNRGN